MELATLLSHPKLSPLRSKQPKVKKGNRSPCEDTAGFRPVKEGAVKCSSLGRPRTAGCPHGRRRCRTANG